MKEYVNNLGEVISLSDEKFDEMVANGELFQCAKCGEWHHAEESIMVDDETWCLPCHDAAVRRGEVWQCYNCDTWHTYDKETPTEVDGDLWCEYCRDEECFCCENCGKWHLNDDAVHIKDADEYWCERCAGNYAYLCDNCGEYFSGSDSVTRVACEDEYWCRDCIEDAESRDRIHWCEVCGEYRNAAYMHYSERQGGWVCDDCEEDARIGDYHSLRERGFDHRYAEGESSDVPCFGFELETEGGDIDERADITEEICGNDISMEHDGSLDDSGIENVSQPMTERYFAEVFPLERWTKALIAAGARSHDAQHCGLHVHVGRAVAGDDADERCLTAGRIRSFLWRYSDVVKRFARRTDDYWCHYDHSGGLFEAYTDDAEMRHLGAWRSDRYCALNTQNMDGYTRTIEYRIFKGTLNAATIRASVEFCFRLTRFCRESAAEDLTWEKFRAWGSESDALKERLDKAEVKAGMRTASPVEESAEVVNQ